jgi:hypothetical protein
MMVVVKELVVDIWQENGGINLMRWKEMEQLGMTQKHAVDKHANQMTQKAPPLH